MPKENMTRYAILGLLASGCTSGYEMKHTIDTSLNHFWKISFGQVYPTLKRLEAEGLIVEEVTDGERKQFALTENGHVELERWVAEPSVDLPVQRNDLLLKLYFARHASKEVTLQKIQEHARLLEERLETYQAIDAMIRSYPDSNDAVYWLMTLDYGIRKTRALLDWCDASLETLEGGN